MNRNLISGLHFEFEMAELLRDEGFWVLRIPQNHGGQQPADLVVAKSTYHALIDCKVVSNGRFVLSRIEDNQHYSMEKFREATGEPGWFAILMPNKEIRMLDMLTVQELEASGRQSLSPVALTDERYTRSLDDWLRRVEEGWCE